MLKDKTGIIRITLLFNLAYMVCKLFILHIKMVISHSKKCWVVSNHVGSNMDNPNR